MATEAPVAAVVFDLDDTLFAQADWLAGVWDAVAKAATAQGVDPVPLARALREIAAEGSAKGGIIDRALTQVGAVRIDVEPLVRAFHGHAPASLPRYPGVDLLLDRLAARVPVGLVTDGHVGVQQGKVAALGLSHWLSTVVYSDALGREHRKPDRLPFDTVVCGLGVDASSIVYVGDNPTKDVCGATQAGIRAVRVHTGEYAGAPDVIEPWGRVTAVGAVLEVIEPWLAGPVGERRGRQPAVTAR